MKGKLKKIISALLASLMVMSSGANIFYANEEENILTDSDIAYYENAADDVISDSGAEVEEGGISLYSLFPLPEIDAKVDLRNLHYSELKKIKVSDILLKMKDYNDEDIVIEDGRNTSVWCYSYTDDTWEKKSMDDYLDLTLIPTDYLYYEVIVGSGNQLDTGNIRYRIRIYKSDSYSYIYTLYEQKADGTRSMVLSDDYGRMVLPQKYSVESDYYLNITLEKEYEGIDVKVYEGSYSTAAEAIKSGKDITSLVYNVTDMDTANTGYKMECDKSNIDYSYEYENKTITIVYFKNNEPIAADREYLSLKPKSVVSSLELNIYEYNNEIGNKINSTYDDDLDYCTIHNKFEEYDEYEDYDTEHNIVYCEKYSVNSKYSKDVDYAVVLDGYDSTGNDITATVYEGYYESANDAEASGKDITENIKSAYVGKWLKEDKPAIFTIVYKNSYNEPLDMENIAVKFAPYDSNNTYNNYYTLYNSEGEKINHISSTVIDENSDIKNLRLQVSAQNYNKDNDYYIEINSRTVSVSAYAGELKTRDEIRASKQLELSVVPGSTSEEATSYKGKWADTSKQNVITLVYEDDDEILGFESILLSVVEIEKIGTIYARGLYDDTGESAVYDYDYDYFRSDDNIISRAYNYILKSNYSMYDEYNFRLRYESYIDSEGTYNDYVVKAVAGAYKSLEEAVNCTDIKDDLFGDGYRAAYRGNGVTFTVFTKADIYQYTVKVEERNTQSSLEDIEKYFDNHIINGSSDRFFRFIELKNAETDEVFDTYTLPYRHDNYYGYGYQTLFINDEDADLSKISPYVFVSKYVNLYNNGVLQETDKNTENQYLPVQDFSSNTVHYELAAENHKNNRNYDITVVKKQEGPKLYVNGPDEREMMIGLNNSDFGYEDYHDIFIANIGNEPLTGIKVTLENPVNIKLDDYWTIGNNGNDTLAAFNGTNYKDESGDPNLSLDSEDAELYNVGKIRLLADGEGVISGTLRITADGQEERVIKLIPPDSPKITTDTVVDGVKYVLYSTIITTDNMYDAMGNEVTFELVDGKGELPDGLELYESGEIYGVPKEAGTFKFTVRANNSYKGFESDEKEITLTIKDNTDENVKAEEEKDPDSKISIYLGDENQNFDVSKSEFTNESLVLEFAYSYAENEEDFDSVWIDGEKLDPSEYTIEDGSSKITLSDQTIKNQYNGTHTVTTGYHSDTKGVKKTAQNYTVTGGKDKPSNNGGSTSGGGSSGGGGGGSSVKYTYTVTYESNGGSAVQSQKVVRGQKISFLATPEKPGYRFIGWYTDSELTKKFDETKALTSSIKLYAKYEQVECTVWFNSNGGSEVNSISILGDTALNELPSVQKEGYEFKGWFTESGEQFNEGDKIYANTTLYAKWELIIPDEAPEDVSGFVDVDVNSWYYNDIAWAYDNNIMVGYNNAVFAPNNTMVLSNIVTVLAKLSGDDLEQYNNSSIEGIQENMWYTSYAKWAYANGIIEGMDFEPNVKISREDMAVILVRFLEYIDAEYNISDEEISFNDGEFISEYSKDSVETLYKLGILLGRGNNIIDPDSFITRAEFAALINRMYSLI